MWEPPFPFRWRGQDLRRHDREKLWFTAGMNMPAKQGDAVDARDETADALKTLVPRARASVSTIFFVNGFVFASWVPHIPLVKDYHALSDAALGGVLFAMALGAILALALAGRWVGRFGSRRVTRVAALGFCAALPLLIVSSNLFALVSALVLFGALNATLDIAMNAQAVEIEKRHGRAIMSSFHGLFSLGGLVGAATAGICLGTGLQALQHMLAVSGVFCLLVIVVLPGLLRVGEGFAAQRNEPIFVKPTATLLGLGILAFFGLLIEGAVADWSAVYLRDTLRTSSALAATGFTAFSLTMAAGRFTGDLLVRKMGAERMLRVSGWTSASGMALAMTAQHPAVVVMGFGMVGLGASNIIPILFSAAGRVDGTSTGNALAAVASTGYLGFLIGPPLIGAVAHVSTMAAALGVLASFCVLIALRARAVHAR